MFRYEEIKNPEYYQENVLLPHSDHIAYRNAIEEKLGKSSLRKSLNGLWKFHYARRIEDSIPHFESPEYSCKDWEDIVVPTHIQLEGSLKEGENKLAVQVYKWSAASWCEDQDFFRFSGIFRDVYLYTLPKLHLADLQLRTELSRDFKEGKLYFMEEESLRGKIFSLWRRFFQQTFGFSIQCQRHCFWGG